MSTGSTTRKASRVAHGFEDWQARELATHLNAAFARSPLEVLHGNKVIEVRPQGVNKGRGVRLVMQQLGEPDLIFAAGDDRTDEDLFGALPGAGGLASGPMD